MRRVIGVNGAASCVNIAAHNKRQNPKQRAAPSKACHISSNLNRRADRAF
jgi:hypothetical protein